MANEARVTSGLQILKTSGSVRTLDYQSRPQSFTVTVDGTLGPTPGAIAVPLGGVDVDLSRLTTMGLCRVMNLDATNYVLWGVYEPDTDYFYPTMEIGPGETYVFKLPRFGPDETTGTGTQPGMTNVNGRFRLVPNTAACNVTVEAFER